MRVEFAVNTDPRDAHHDYLTVMRDEADWDETFVASDLPIDPAIDVLVDESGAVVGLGLRDARQWSPAAWWTLPARNELDADLFDAVSEWLGARERGTSGACSPDSSGSSPSR